MELAKELNPDYVMFCVFVPMPGSELFTAAVNSGRVIPEHENWENYITLLSASPPPVSMCALTRQ